jgi:hypothetical protein
MKKRRIARDVVVLLISTLITIAAWVGFEVYRAYTRVTLPEGVEEYLTPLTPTLDIEVLESLEKRG